MRKGERGDPGTVGARISMGALAGLVVITAAWWALALWPVEGVPSDWLLRARQVCFNAGPSGLPDASGWMLLIGQPIGMFALLMVVAGDGVRAGIREARSTGLGIATLGLGALVLVGVVSLGAARMISAPGDSEWLEVASAAVPETYPRVERPPPPLALTDQHGRTFDWSLIRGRPALVTFGFGHCETVCPLTVMNARRVQERLAAEGRDLALVVITLDPWRDTPRRLPALAQQFELGPDAYVLSGSVERVNGVLDGLEMARERVPETGDIIHPALVWVLDESGVLIYRATGHADLVEELVRRL